MTEFREELEAMVRVYAGKKITEETMQKLTKEQQDDLLSFISTMVLDNNVESIQTTSFLNGFIFGHDWVKTHWALW